MEQDGLRVRWIATGLILASLWFGIAFGVAPRGISSAYHGESLSILNRVFQGRTHRPLEHFLRLWSEFAWALTLAGAVGVTFGWWLKRDVEDRIRRRAWFVYFTLFLGVTVLSGPRHDYVAFQEIWASLLRGGDPWAIHPVYGYATHAYGPLFNLLAFPFAINPLLPKLIFAATWLGFGLWLDKAPGSRRFAWFWLINPFTWVEIAWFGHFDILVALLCVVAVRAAGRSRPIQAGMALGAGVLLKIVPIVIAPFFWLEPRQKRLQAISTLALSVGLGYAVSALGWGPSVFRPLRFAASRGSTFASIFRYLRGAYSPLNWFLPDPNVDFFSTPILILAGLTLWIYARRRALPLALTATLATLITVLFYRVGFLQYQIVLYLLIANWFRERPASRAQGVAITLYLGWLGLLDLWYASVDGVLHPGDPYAWADDLVGLPTFLLGLTLLNTLAQPKNLWSAEALLPLSSSPAET